MRKKKLGITGIAAAMAGGAVGGLLAAAAATTIRDKMEVCEDLGDDELEAEASTITDEDVAAAASNISSGNT